MFFNRSQQSQQIQSKRVRDRISSNVYCCIHCCCCREPGPPPAAQTGAASGELRGEELSERERNYDFQRLAWPGLMSPGQGPVLGCRGSDVKFSEWPQWGADGLLVTSGPLTASDLHHIPPWLAASSNCFFRAWKEIGVLELCFISVTSLRKLRLLSISANKRWEILTLCQYLLTEFSVSQTVFRQCW